MGANGGSDDSPTGDRTMAACLIAAGVRPAEVIDSARRGGLFTLERDGLRIQCIWKTDAGGSHHNHVHAGPVPTPDARAIEARDASADCRSRLS